MKPKKNIHLSNKIKEIVIKVLLVASAIILVGGIVIGSIFNDSMLAVVLGAGLGVGIPIIFMI